MIFDEVHVQRDRDLWDVMALASGARHEPLMVGITTAGLQTDRLGDDTLCYSLYQYGKRVASGEVVDPTFFFAWWEPADPAADHRDPNAWREANPGYGDIVAEADFAAAVLRTPEGEFRAKRLNQFVAQVTGSWLPPGAWDACFAPDRHLARRERVVLGFDGSRSGDATALVAVSTATPTHVEVLGCWEPPPDTPPDWQVHRGGLPRPNKPPASASTSPRSPATAICGSRSSSCSRPRGCQLSPSASRPASWFRPRNGSTRR